MSPTSGPPRAVLTPAEQVARQETRRRSLQLILSLFMVAQGIMVIGGIGMWLIFSFVSDSSAPEQVRMAQVLLPSVRLITLYSVLLLMLTLLTRRAVTERWSSALRWNLGLIAALALAFPLGTLAAPLLLLVLAPKRWSDLRPRQSHAPGVPLS